MHVHIHFKKDGYKIEVEGVADHPQKSQWAHRQKVVEDLAVSQGQELTIAPNRPALKEYPIELNSMLLAPVRNPGSMESNPNSPSMAAIVQAARRWFWKIHSACSLSDTAINAPRRKSIGAENGKTADGEVNSKGGSA